MEYESKSINDYSALIRRRSRVVISTIVAVSLVGVMVAYSIPAMYRSTSHFLIEKQNIPQDIVQSTVTSYVDEEIQEVRQRVMSSATLVQIIQEHDLYGNLTATGQSQLAVEALRSNTLLETEVFDVVNPRSGRAMLATISFTLSFDYENAQTAQDVASVLANLYLTENVQSRTDQVQETLEFILSDIERYSQEVEHTGKLLADFKVLNLGNLPELMNYNLQTIERSERQIDGIDREIRDTQNRKLQFASELASLVPPDEAVYDETGAPILNPTEQLSELQRERMRLISVYSAEHPDVVQIQKQIGLLSSAVSGSGGYLIAIQTELSVARSNLVQVAERYSPDHPDVIRAQRTVSSLENEVALAQASAKQHQPSTSQSDPYTQQLTAQMNAEDANIMALQRRKAELQAKLHDLEGKVALSPQIEREYEVLNRSNELAIANLDDVRAQFEDAQKAEKLESAGSGDRFTIVEGATLPLEPYKPNRTAIILLAFIMACGLGLVAATVLDTMDETVKDSRDVVRLTKTPPIAVIPYVETDVEQRQRSLSNVAMVAVVLGGVATAYLIAYLAG